MAVGYGEAALVVPEGTPMGGYVDRPGPSTGVLDPLQVSAVTWSAGGRRFALVVADVICVNDDLVQRVRREAGCELWLAASHTHAGPETGCVPGGGPTPGPWAEAIAAACRSAVQAAVAGERPCEGGAHRGELRGVGADRSRPDAEAVVPLDVIAVRDGGLVGVVVVLPVHPTVLPASNRMVSADLVGAVRRRLRERLGGQVWVVVATGAAGDISTRHTRRGQDAAELDRLGDVVAARCIELLAEPATPAWPSAAPAPHSSRSLSPSEAPIDTDADVAGMAPVEVAWVGRRLALRRATVAVDVDSLVADVERAAADPVAARLARSRLEGVRARTSATGPIGVEVSVARLGDLLLVGLPGEPFLAVAASIADSGAGQPTVVLGYVNGYPGYLPTADAYARPEYEVLASQVAPGSAELLAATARDLLAEVSS
ncbi:hypothetical protein ACFXJ8_12590 [Nonomuraea sp. NPDC059194]|uniref:hypothetical protein n=1 Tax=Nonomuraea sp. NPDC059194 TaxID=3346764 RepID=UPI0036B2487B